MTLQRAATLYPINSTTVDTGTGIDIRALDDVEAGATDTTQTINVGTQGAAGERRFDPATAGTGSVRVDTTQDGKGWAIPLSDAIGDMAVGTDNVPYLKAQTATVSMSGTASGTGTGDVGTVDSLLLRAALWKWNTSTDTATLIKGATGDTPSISAVIAYSGTAWSGNVSITSIPATTFAANEVLFLVLGGRLSCGAGLLGAARTTTWILNVDVSTTKIVFGTSGLLELGEMTGSSSGSGSATGVGGLVLPTVGSAAGSGVADGVMAATGAMVGAAAGAAVVAAEAAAIAGTVGSAAGSGSANGQASIVLGTVGTVAIGDCPADFSGSDPSKQIAGVVYDTNGAPAPGATVKLFRQSDDLQVGSTTSAGDGTYSFTRDAADPNTYYAVSYSDSTHHGTTDRDLVPA